MTTHPLDALTAAEAYVLVSADSTTSKVQVGGGPVIAWYHFTRFLIEAGHHPSDLIWGVVLAYEDKGPPEGDYGSTDPESKTED